MDNIKYGIHPVYTKSEVNEESYKLLVGYIVSKCYVIDENRVQFLYTKEEECIKIVKRRGYHFDYSNYYIGLYDNYESARKACDIKNITIGLKEYKIKALQNIEKLIEEYTKDIEANKVLKR